MCTMDELTALKPLKAYWEMINDDKTVEISIDDDFFEIGKILIQDHPNLLSINEWYLFQESSMFKKIIDKIITFLNDTIDFDCIIALGASGSPIGFVLSQELNKRVFVIDEKNKKLPNAPIFLPNIAINDFNEIRGKKVILVDSVLKSGYIARNAFKILNELECKVQCIITVLFNYSFFNEIILKNYSGFEEIDYKPFYLINDAFLDAFEKSAKSATFNFKSDRNSALQINPEQQMAFTTLTKEVYASAIEILQKNKDAETFSEYSSQLKAMCSNKSYNQDTCKYYFNELISYLKSPEYEISLFVLSNYLAFTELIASGVSDDEYISDTDDNYYLINDIYEDDSNPKDQILFTHFMNYLIKRDGNKIEKKFIDDGLKLISNFCAGEFEPLFSLFKRYCFKNASSSDSGLNNFVSKLLYSIFEDLFYAKRYNKKNGYSIFQKEYTEILNAIFDPLDDTINWDSLYYSLRKILDILKDLAKGESISISGSFAVPEKLYDIDIFFDNLLNMTDDFDEWKLFSNPISFKPILYRFKKKIEKNLNDSNKLKDLHFIAIGMSGTPVSYCLQYMLKKETDRSINVYFLDEKIFYPKPKIHLAIQSEEPVFIFDSVVKTGFNAKYVRNILDNVLSIKDNPIYYMVIADLQKYRIIQIKDTFQEYINFKFMPLFQRRNSSGGKKKQTNISNSITPTEPFEDSITLIENTINKYTNFMKTLSALLYDIQEIPDDYKPINCFKCGEELDVIYLENFIDDVKSLDTLSILSIIPDEKLSFEIMVCHKCNLLYLQHIEKSQLFEKRYLPILMK